MSYNITFLPEVESYLSSLGPREYRYIGEGIEEIKKNPYSKRPEADIMRIGGRGDYYSPPMYRLKAGRHRLEYFVNETAKRIQIVKAIDLKVEILNSDYNADKSNIKPEISSIKVLDEAETINFNDKSNGNGSKSDNINLKVLEEAVNGATTSRQTIGIWGPEISAVLWYLKKTTPEFSISDEARSLLEKKLQIIYPDLYKHVKEEMSKNTEGIKTIKRTSTTV